MSNILYYSNFCENCKTLLMQMNRYTNKDDTHFINIDKRRTDEKGNTIVSLESGQDVIMPSTVKRVPALLILNDNYRVIFGAEIMAFLNIDTHTTSRVDTKKDVFETPYEEPTTFEWMSASGVSSDSFSYLDTAPEDLNAKGSGGERQMYNYSTNTDIGASSIHTPDENYKADTIGNDGNSTMESIQSKRESDIKNIQSGQKQF